MLLNKTKKTVKMIVHLFNRIITKIKTILRTKNKINQFLINQKMKKHRLTKITRKTKINKLRRLPVMINLNKIRKSLKQLYATVDVESLMANLYQCLPTS